MIATEISKKLTKLLEAYAEETEQHIMRLDITWKVDGENVSRVVGIDVSSKTFPR